MPARLRPHPRATPGWILAAALLTLVFGLGSPDAAPKDNELVAVKISLYSRDASGKAVAAPNVKFHVTKLTVDPVTRAPDGTAAFRIEPGEHTLTTVTGRNCRFVFKVSGAEPAMNIALVVPSSGEVCLPLTLDPLAAANPAGSGASTAGVSP